MSEAPKYFMYFPGNYRWSSGFINMMSTAPYGGSDISELTAFWSKRMSPQWKMQIYGVVGFTDASPDAGAGVMFEHRF